MRWDYGRPEQGLSFEHTNFYESLVAMGHEVIYFDFMELRQQLGRERMNLRLRETVDAEHPDLLFSFLFGNELDPDMIRGISLKTDTLTLNWFADDHWRFENFSRHWAPCFNWIVTTAWSAVPKYAAIGYKNAIKSQWGCNHFTYRDQGLPLKYDVTFVGQPHGDRRELVGYLRRNGIDVRAWGTGWETGRLEQGDLVAVFNQSRINLNFSNASSKARFRRWLRWEPQIKARNFEIPGCAGFELSGEADDLGSYFRMGEEIVTFRDRRQLLERIRYYLDREDERARVARAGWRRVLSEHTYDHRFREIFRVMGLEGSGATTAESPDPKEGASDAVREQR